jgi:hypothetical protein
MMIEAEAGPITGAPQARERGIGAYGWVGGLKIDCHAEEYHGFIER